MNLREYFLGCEAALAAAARPGQTEFEVLRASGIIREWMVQHQKVRQAFDATRIHPKFRVPKEGAGVTWRTQVGTNEVSAWEFAIESGGVRRSISAPLLDPSMYRPDELEQVDLDNFVGRPVLMIDEKWRDVRTVINVAANSLGGVHFSEKLSQREAQDLHRDMGFRLGDGSGGSLSEIARTTRQIILCTLDAVRPVMEELRHR